ncbi:hypothetical protein QEH52_09365 [Coraliomargarita sp. SDUM461003]|uniref:Uncharacterized protein n=1 Tax=Thalassobacterium maritimum TaxID=3041265 RepID=A0ABU1AU87_9BACT|nr:hypothetical protein [Coraliomargarita sp. SDUM461003]MDQ8207717.1 hypothetical protein [Coraliomargarita sp. SDUM461003]
MAWRIADYIERGEIDNRTKGQVVGQLWLNGIEEPIILELTGNPYRDLAGQQLRFKNPKPKPMPEDLRDFAREQTGVVGDITAARKVKILEIEDDELEHYYTNKIPMPYHWGNCLYLEWHSVRNGRVVIEAADYELVVEPEAAWQMSEAEEADQLQANARAMIHFMDQLVEAADPEDDDEDSPQSEIEAKADADTARSGLLNDRVIERLKQDENANAEDYFRILEEERERMRLERGEFEFELDPFKQKNAAEQDAVIDAQNADFEEAMAKEGEPPEMEPDPLYEQCRELGERIQEDIEHNDWLPEGAQEEHPLNALRHGTWFASAKLAGALNGRVDEWPPHPLFAGDCLVRLKKARGYLKDALAALDAVEGEKLTGPDWTPPIREELQYVLHEVKGFINEVRDVLRWEEGKQ